MKCIKCDLEWNVSEKRDLNKRDICPHCGQKILNVKTKGKKHRCSKDDNRLTKVLLRNKSKFNCLLCAWIK